MTDSEIHNILVILSLLRSELSEVNVLLLAKEMHGDRTLPLSEVPTLLTRIHCGIVDFNAPL